VSHLKINDRVGLKVSLCQPEPPLLAGGLTDLFSVANVDPTAC
jgi:hypothetical protein